MLTEEQTKSIKVQLIEQIGSSFPEEKKQYAISQIESMDSEDLEKFLIRNGLIKENTTSEKGCIFCSIVFGDINSHRIEENSKAVAVLEINPLSKGHTLIIPKEHVIFGEDKKNIPKEISALIKKVSDIIKKRLSPERISISSSNIMGHEIINLIPNYPGEEIKERKRASSEELDELKKILTKKTFSKPQKEKKDGPKKEKKEVQQIVKKFEERFWLPKRIP